MGPGVYIGIYALCGLIAFILSYISSCREYKEFVDQNSNNIDLISWDKWCENNEEIVWWIIHSVFWSFSLCILIIVCIIELFRKMLCWIRKKNGINE